MKKFITINKHLNFSDSPKENDFITKEIQIDENKILNDQELLLELVVTSVDPYLRTRMNGETTHLTPFPLSEPIINIGVAKVLKSNSERYRVGEYIHGMFPWQELFHYQIQIDKDGDDGLFKIDPKVAPVSSSLSALGFTGISAYLGLIKIGKPKRGETLVVSAGAGAVGSVVGQLGKILGLFVIGIAGSQDKVNFMTEQLGFDIGLNYNSPNFKEELKQAISTRGIDIYFENVGGSISDNMWKYLNRGARVPVCGTISNYNIDLSQDNGPRIQFDILRASAMVQGFLIFNYSRKEREEAQAQLIQYYNQGLIKDIKFEFNGFNNIVPSFLKLFNGSNIGKIIVNVK